jgi:hypothetical protein
VHRLAVASKIERVGSSRPMKGTVDCERERGGADAVVELLVFYTRLSCRRPGEVATSSEGSGRRADGPGRQERCAGPSGPPYPEYKGHFTKVSIPSPSAAYICARSIVL